METRSVIQTGEKETQITVSGAVAFTAGKTMLEKEMIGKVKIWANGMMQKEFRKQVFYVKSQKFLIPLLRRPQRLRK